MTTLSLPRTAHRNLRKEETLPIAIRRPEAIYETHVLSLLRDWRLTLSNVETRLLHYVCSNGERQYILGLLRSLHEGLHVADKKMEVMHMLQGEEWRRAKRNLETRIAEFSTMLRYCERLHFSAIPR